MNKNIKELIGSYLYDKLNINDKTNYVIETIHAKKLITYQRFDIISKYMYLLYKEKKINSDLAMQIYKEHISIFSEGKFYEPGSDTKKDFKAFIKEFNVLFDNIKRKGFDDKVSLIPVGKDYSIIDGGHRVAIAAYLNLNIKIIRFTDIEGAKYDYNYFKKREMNELYLDYLALNYTYINTDNMYVMCLWPSATRYKKDKDVEKIIHKYCHIFYKKSIKLDYKTLTNLITQVYLDQSWIGKPENKFSGVIKKVNACYHDSNTLFYFLEGNNLKNILKMKDEIRKLYKMGKHSVHITDSREEATQLANLILNENSVHHLKYSNSLKFINDYKKITSTVQNNDTIFNPEFTLSTYGIKSTTLSENYLINQTQLKFDICYDFRNYFYYMNKKFLVPNRAKELSNPEQANYYNKIINMKEIRIFKSLYKHLTKFKYYIKTAIIRILREMKLLDFVSKIFRR